MMMGDLSRENLSLDNCNSNNNKGDKRKREIPAMEEFSGAKIKIDRNVYLREFQTLNHDEEKLSICDPSNLGCVRQPRTILKNVIPAIGWLRSYRWKDWLVKDLIAGFTVAVMNIPQGMAYAILGNVPPVVGIYMAFFPVLVYSILGTSRHISMGSFAVICLMAGNVVTKYANDPFSTTSDITNGTMVSPSPTYTPIQVAAAVSFFVAVFQLVMFVLRLGVVCTLLSETLISGFTAGAAIHVFTSQLKDIFGLHLERVNGPFKIIYIYKEFFSKFVTETNQAALICSAITMLVLIANNALLKPWVQAKTIFPIPIELIVVLCGTLASKYGNLSDIYSLKTVGEIPTGFPEPALPNFSLFPAIALDSAIIAVVAYIVSLSMALIFANKLKYEIDPNQELFAQGCGNLVGSFFSCLPFSASLSRSAIQQAVGGCTQLASIFSCCLLLIVLLWIGPFFETLPRCILASLIVVALKGIILQVTDIVSIGRVSFFDLVIWLATYLTVIFVEIEYGLLTGVVVSIVILFTKGMKTDISSLERIPNTEIYIKPNRFVKTESIPGITIIQYTGGLNFVNKGTFKNKTFSLIDCSPERRCSTSNKIHPTVDPEKQQLKVVILDFKSVPNIDSSAANNLKIILQEMQFIGRAILFVGLQDQPIEMLSACAVFGDQSAMPLFPTVHDAVIYAQKLPTNVYSIRL